MNASKRMALAAICVAATVSSYADANIAEDVKRAKAGRAAVVPRFLRHV